MLKVSDDDATRASHWFDEDTSIWQSINMVNTIITPASGKYFEKAMVTHHVGIMMALKHYHGYC